MSEPVRDVFLSSAFLGFMEERKRILEVDPDRIWISEAERPDLDSRKEGISSFQILDEMVTQIRKSRLFVCVLGGQYGSSLFDTESVSFLEAEIYQAALFNADVRFFLLEPFSPDERLAGLLDLLRILRPGSVPVRALGWSELLDNLKRTLAEVPRRRRRWNVPIRGFVGALARARGDTGTDLEFMDRTFRRVNARPDRDRIRSLLDGLGSEMSMERRLTRMWIALRELSSAPYNEPENSEYLPLWEAALGAWSGAAAWYGLHGHLYAGRLSAVNSILAIRARLGSSRERTTDFIQGSKGARASEYFSISKLMTSRSQRFHYLSLAEQDIDDAISSELAQLTGYLAIRGHIRLALRRRYAAMDDFREVLRLKRISNNEAGVGEALGDVGLAQMALGDHRRALSSLNEGLELARRSGEPGFAIRIQKRLAMALMRNWQPLQSLRVLSDAYERADALQMYGQIEPPMRLAHQICSGVRSMQKFARL